MVNALLGIKKGMISTYDSRGRRVGSTVIEIAPNFVTQIKKTDGKDGYAAIQLGMGTKKSVSKAQIGHVKKAGIDQKIRWLKETRTTEVDVKLGEEITVGQVFKVGDAVKVTGVSRGRGFAGGVKRYGFAGGPKTHGQSDRHRAPGSIGSGTTPGRVLKGKRMAGHMGVEIVSVRNLEVTQVDKKHNLLVVKGGVPGAPGTLVTVYKLGQIKGYTPPPEEKPEEESEEAADGPTASTEVVVDTTVDTAIEGHEPVSSETVIDHNNQGEQNA